MRMKLFALPLLLMLAACQAPQPNRDYDTSKDFGAYRTWSWKEPAVQYRPQDPRLQSDLTDSRIRGAINEQLEQRGLRMAANNSSGDLQVQAWMIVDDKQQQVSTSYGGGGYWGGPWGGAYGGPAYIDTRTVDYQVGTLQIDMFDSKDGKLVWRASSQKILNDGALNPAQRDAEIRQSVGRILSQYPPR
ncbi:MULTISPECIES: DUF4136 domain-containing protein [Pseudomonas]|uniref:DUF4136 domain-containing protein n=1 Tax=Pseudomonas marincola TaxID=437900 RepID=A0A653E3N5_9PSED|nr:MULTISPECIES: DUF4136 domain-containing protein [Pseudomonas]MBQ57197.1 hypothetical protein [Pseudomonadaceae bacterium]CAE6889636.1 conserved exported protein of unknown function [Pseudomonas marincola]HCP55833.1 DUF4136 domain-containing protein [Pseudomonas sp.]